MLCWCAVASSLPVMVLLLTGVVDLDVVLLLSQCVAMVLLMCCWQVFCDCLVLPLMLLVLSLCWLLLCCCCRVVALFCCCLSCCCSRCIVTDLLLRCWCCVDGASLCLLMPLMSC